MKFLDLAHQWSSLDFFSTVMFPTQRKGSPSTGASVSLIGFFRSAVELRLQWHEETFQSFMPASAKKKKKKNKKKFLRTLDMPILPPTSESLLYLADLFGEDQL